MVSIKDYKCKHHPFGSRVGLQTGTRCIQRNNDGGVPVYNSYVFGREALAEAVASEFGVVVGGTIADPLNRKMALGWTGIAGWELFRTADNNNGGGAMYKINTAASVN